MSSFTLSHFPPPTLSRQFVVPAGYDTVELPLQKQQPDGVYYLVSGGFLQSATEATHRACIHVTRLMRPYSESFQLVYSDTGKAGSNVNAAAKSQLGITHFDSASLVHQKRENALHAIGAVAGHTEENTKEESKAALFTLYVFYFYAAAFPDSLESALKRAFSDSKSKFDDAILFFVSTVLTIVAPVSSLL